ncbi:tyrosine-type recombinase/integrase [Pseudonocardia sp. ICBG1293]|uniref:tyrosine-type recombinase/integrase n=1 Tax=Pseudonocardia sp. ICBG1293 TaxID=2844382 RepID=UPI001CCC098C|nr:tyrosine-type recombinase/integrase [Pseudonocardia sp. ICBG1293]
MTSKTKSRAGRRGIGLPDALVELLKRHREAQAQERAAACEMWDEGDYVFTSPTGRPLNPSTDYHRWKKLLDRAGVPERRLHDARHTAATVLLLLGVPERTVMSVMGWASTAIAARYQHVVAAARRDVAVRVGDLIWKPNEGGGGASPAA